MATPNNLLEQLVRGLQLTLPGDPRPTNADFAAGPPAVEAHSQVTPYADRLQQLATDVGMLPASPQPDIVALLLHELLNPGAQGPAQAAPSPTVLASETPAAGADLSERVLQAIVADPEMQAKTGEPVPTRTPLEPAIDQTDLKLVS